MFKNAKQGQSSIVFVKATADMASHWQWHTHKKVNRKETMCNVSKENVKFWTKTIVLFTQQENKEDSRVGAKWTDNVDLSCLFFPRLLCR